MKEFLIALSLPLIGLFLYGLIRFLIYYFYVMWPEEQAHYYAQTNPRRQENCCVYLFEICGFDGFKFLKVGFSQNIHGRDFKLNGSKRLIDTIQFTNTKTAFDYEQSIHEYLMDHQLPTRLAKRYLQNGWTECYYHGTINQLPRR